MPRSLLLLLVACSALAAQKAPQLPFVDNVRTKFAPSGDTTWTVAATADFGAKITATYMTPDGRYMAVGDNDGNVTLFDLQARQALWTRPVIAGGAAVHVLKIDAQGAHGRAGSLFAAVPGGHKDGPFGLSVFARWQYVLYSL